MYPIVSKHDSMTEQTRQMITQHHWLLLFETPKQNTFYPPYSSNEQTILPADYIQSLLGRGNILSLVLDRMKDDGG